MTIHLAPHILRDYQRVQHTLARLERVAEPWALVAPGSESPRGQVIVFPGSFNPPTLAHVAMLRQARRWAERRARGHWQVYAALSWQVVDKETVERMTLLDRVVLLMRVLKEQGGRTGILLLNQGLYVGQAEGARAAFPQVRRLVFLVGFDKIVQILDPHYYTDRDAALHELFALAQILVAPRGQEGEAALQALLARAENRPFARFITPLPLDPRYRDMSSTRVRQEAELDELPASVREFLLRTCPYAPPAEDNTAHDPYAERTRALQALLANGYGGRSGDSRRSARYRPRSADSA